MSVPVPTVHVRATARTLGPPRPRPPGDATSWDGPRSPPRTPRPRGPTRTPAPEHAGPRARRTRLPRRSAPTVHRVRRRRHVVTFLVCARRLATPTSPSPSRTWDPRSRHRAHCGARPPASWSAPSHSLRRASPRPSHGPPRHTLPVTYCRATCRRWGRSRCAPSPRGGLHPRCPSAGALPHARSGWTATGAGQFAVRRTGAVGASVGDRRRWSWHQKLTQGLPPRYAARVARLSIMAS